MENKRKLKQAEEDLDYIRRKRFKEIPYCNEWMRFDGMIKNKMKEIKRMEKP
jgi:hypothetical protein